MTAVLTATLRSDSVYVDVGTNRGQILANAVRVAPRGAHVAFEPIAALATKLAARFPTVDCRNVAVAATAGTASFFHFRKLDGWSGLRRRASIDDAQGDPEIVEVTVVTLDAELTDIDRLPSSTRRPVRYGLLRRSRLPRFPSPSAKGRCPATRSVCRPRR